MTITTMIKRTAVASLLALAGCATQSTNTDADNWPGYRTDSDGNLLKTAEGRCWRTPNWTPAMAVEECDVAITGVAEPDPEDAPQLAEESAEEAAEETVVLPAPLTIEFAFGSASISEAQQRYLETWYQQVAQWWQQQGESVADLSVKGHGPDDSVTGSACASLRGEALKQCHQQDRRVTLRVTEVSDP